MDADHCHVCGQPLPGLLDDRPHRHAPRPASSGGSSRAGAALLIAAGIVVVAIIAITQPDAESDDPVEDAAPDTVADEDVTPATAADLAAVIGDLQVAYLAEDGLVLVDPGATITATRHPIRPAAFLDYFDPLDEMQLINEGQRSIGLLLPAYEAIEISPGGPMLRNEFGGFTLIDRRSEDGPRLQVSSGYVNFAAIEVPVGARRFDVDRVGVLIATAAGETLIATQRGFELFHDAPVRAAGTDHLVEVRCDDQFDCRLQLIDRRGGPTIELPAALADPGVELSLSPDAAWLLVRRPGASPAMYDVAGERLVLLPSDLPPHVAWAPDSSSFAWFEPGVIAPLLRVYQPERQNVTAIDLGDLGAPSRSGDAVELFTRAA